MSAEEEERLDNLFEQIRDVDLEKVQQSGQGYSALCPAHDDHNPSLQLFRAESGEIVLHCYAGCDKIDVCESIGLDFTDLWPRARSKRCVAEDDAIEGEETVTASGVSVATLAAAKALPLQFLHELGMADGDGVVHIAYRNAKQEISAIRKRSDVVAKKGSRWAKEPKLIPYGVWRLNGSESLYIVEGESDCWTLWHHGYAALGIPGATNTKLLKRQHLAGAIEIIRGP